MKKFKLYLVYDDYFADGECDSFSLVGSEFYENTEGRISDESTLYSVFNPLAKWSDELSEDENKSIEENISLYEPDLSLSGVQDEHFEFSYEDWESGHSLYYDGELVRDLELIKDYLNSNWKYFEIVDIIHG